MAQSSGFSDVDDGRFFASSVEWAADNGITTGIGNNQFAPDRGVTRGEVVTFLKRYHDAFVASGPALGTPIANGCTLTGRSVFDDWNGELSFSNPTGSTADAWVDWAIRDAGGVRRSTEFSIIENVLAGESVTEEVGTLYDGVGASCDILEIEWR